MKKIMKKIINVFMVVLMILSLSTLSIVKAEEEGLCGNNVYWSVSNDGTLTIKGSGDMNDYFYPRDLPYFNKATDIKKIIIEDGVTKIGNSAFIYLENVEEIIIPKSVKYIGISSFAFISAKTVHYNAENCEFAGENLNHANNYFPQGQTLIIGKDVKNIGANVFYRANFGGQNYETVLYEGSAEEWGNINIDYEGNDVLKSVSFSNNTTEKINILINNQFLESDQPAVSVNDRTLVPMRAIFEALGAEVEWNENTQTVTGTKNNMTVSITINEKNILINEEKNEIDVPAQLINNRTMVPVRAVSEAFDCIVKWNGMKNCVIIIPKNQQPYKINIKKDSEIIATAHYNDMGLLNQITYNTEYSTKAAKALMPIYININGNSYPEIYRSAINHFTNEGKIDFQYINGNISRIDYMSFNNTVYSYLYDYDSNNRIEGYDYSDYNNGIISGGQIKASHLAPEYKYNDNGLLIHHNFKESGGSGSLSYDEHGNLIEHVDVGSIKYNYSNQKLTSATIREFGANSSEIIEYEYVNE